MLKLNIISEELKKEIKLIIIYKFLKRLSFFVFSLLLIYSVAFQASKFILQKYSEENNGRNVINSKNSDEYLQKVKEINEKITNVTTVQADAIAWSDFVILMSETVNDGISIKQLSVDKATDTFLIAGSAVTRDSLLAFKADMDKLVYFSEIDLPISSLLQRENITFTITAKFLSYEF